MAQDQRSTGASEQQGDEQGDVLEGVIEEQEPEVQNAQGLLEEIDRLRSELEQAQAQATEYLEGWQRSQAEFANYRKRQEADRAQMLTFANAALLKKLLPVIDDFERALDTLPRDGRHKPWSEGVQLVKRKLETVLESEDVKPIEVEGHAFDPTYHEAVTYERVEGFDEGQIIGVVQRGYTLGERVLRPALVRVAQSPLAEHGSQNSEIKE